MSGVRDVGRAGASARRACRRSALALLLRAVAVARGAGRTPVRGEGERQRGRRAAIAPLVFRLADEVESQVRIANSILIVRSSGRSTSRSIASLRARADYIGAARRDPDGKAVRIALARKVTVNSMAAGERLFVDLLPESWTGCRPACRAR